MDKNIRELHGKPLMDYTLEAAVDSKVFSEIMLSTDSQKYADIARSVKGVTVPFLREQCTSGDTSSTWDVVREVLEKYSAIGRGFDMFCVLQPTSPLRTARHIVEAFALYQSKNAYSVVSVCELGHSINICNTLPDDRSLVGFMKEQDKYARQMNPTYYRLNGSIYMCNTQAFLSFGTIYREKSYAYVMPTMDSLDIDTVDDLMVANYLISRMNA